MFFSKMKFFFYKIARERFQREKLLFHSKILSVRALGPIGIFTCIPPLVEICAVFLNVQAVTL